MCTFADVLLQQNHSEKNILKTFERMAFVLQFITRSSDLRNYLGGGTPTSSFTKFRNINQRNFSATVMRKLRYEF
jgi:hypothetical protein